MADLPEWLALVVAIAHLIYELSKNRDKET